MVALELLPQRIAEKIAITDDGCWRWTASVGDKGYGQVRYESRTRRAHCLVYELLVGPIPEGLELDHSCRVRRCVNPAHLEPVTHLVNIRRGLPHRPVRQRTSVQRRHRGTTNARTRARISVNMSAATKGKLDRAAVAAGMTRNGFINAMIASLSEEN